MSDLLRLDQLEVSELEWRQPALGRKFELSGPDGAYARLDFRGLASATTAGASAVGTTARASWTFDKLGMLKSHIRIRFADSDQDFATYEPNFTGKKGRLNYASGQYVEFVSTNFFQTEWQWLTPEGDGLIGFRQRQAGKPSAQVFLGEDCLQRVDLDLLLLLAFYLLVLLREEAAKAER